MQIARARVTLKHRNRSKVTSRPVPCFLCVINATSMLHIVPACCCWWALTLASDVLYDLQWAKWAMKHGGTNNEMRKVGHATSLPPPPTHTHTHTHTPLWLCASHHRA